jgi:non-ribosomal peptide synthetase component F
MLMNTALVRADLSGAPSFRELLPRVRDSVLDAYTRQDVPFPRLFAELFPEHGTDRGAVVRVAFNMLSFPVVVPRGPAAPPPSRPALSIDSIPVAEEAALYDLALFCREEGDLYCRFIGAADLFDPEDLAAMGRDFTGLLADAVHHRT